jgi:hypothetical protein
VIRRPLAAIALLPVLLASCHSGSTTMSPQAAASAPVPGVTLPPGNLVDLVPAPDEVPAGMVPVVLGSGPRTLDVVASYSGTGAAATRAAAALRQHGFVEAYVGQYANQATGQVLSVVVSRFGTPTGARADFQDDEQGGHGVAVSTAPIGEASSVTTQDIPGKVTSQLVLVRFLRGTDTWVLAYEAAPKADPQLAAELARRLLKRTAG